MESSVRLVAVVVVIREGVGSVSFGRAASCAVFQEVLERYEEVSLSAMVENGYVESVL